jgi:hypothetical protein
MNCATLAFTGSPLSALLLAGGLCLAVGLFLIFAVRRRRGPAAVALLVLINLLLITGSSGTSSARADTTCLATEPGGQPAATVTVAQISPLVGLAPGVAPSTITGVVTNVTDQPVFVTAVTVAISAVTKAAGATAGACDSTDYALSGEQVAVNEMLAANGSLTFSGAQLGFNDKSVDQDACQGATLTLTYTTS